MYPTLSRAPRARTFVLTLTLALAAGCAPEPDNDRVSSFNHAVTLAKDAGATDCSHPGVEAALQDIMVENGILVCNVALADETGVIYTYSAHLKEFADPKEVTVHLLPDSDVEATTPMPVGSFSKTLTAMAFLELFERGFIKTHANATVTDLTATPIKDVLEMPAHFPAYVGDATLHELLTHTSGMSERRPQADDGDPATRELWGYKALDGTVQALGASAPITQDAKFLGLPKGALDALAYPSAHPRIHYRAMLPPTSPDYDKAVGIGETDGAYSNMNYLLLGAVIDETVTRPGFTGYPSKGPWRTGGPNELTPGYESWTWWVVSGQGSGYDGGAIDLALGSIAREDAGGLPGDVPETSYNSQSGSILVHSTSWTLNGYEGPDGGWVMPAADVARIANLLNTAPPEVAESEVFDALAVYREDLTGIGRYGYGTQFLDADEKSTGMIGHGGTIRGFIAGGYAFPTLGDHAVGFTCDTQPANPGGAAIVLHDDIARDVYEAWMEDGDPVCVTPGVVGGSKSIAQLGSAWFPTWQASVADDVATAGAGATMRAWEAALEGTTAGAAALRHLDAGDYDQAASCLLGWAGDRTATWTCK